jgi:hypothetical protein
VKSGGFYGASLSKFIIMTEEWKDIKGYEGIYQVSNHGRIKSLRFKKEKILKAWNNSHGYLQVKLFTNGLKNMPKVHRLVAETFLCHDINRTHVNHIDGNKLNNCIKNLEWVNQRENNCYQHINRGMPTGVTYLKENKKYMAKINLNGKQIYLGSFVSLEDAHKARLNFELNNNLINKYNGKNAISI